MEEERHYWAWAASGALHGTMLVLILLGVASAPRFEDNTESIPVETVSLSELNQIMNGEKDAKPVPEQPPKPEPVQPPEPPPDLRAAEEAQPTPPPRPEAPPPPKQEAPHPPPRTVENAPAPPERPKEPRPEPPKPDLIAKAIERETPEPRPERVYDPKAIAKLVAEPRPRAAANASSEEANAAARGLPHHNAPHMSMSLASALDAWLTESYLNCWTPPPVMPDGDVYVAEIKVVFKPDGSLSSRPVLLNPPTDPAWRAHAESAIRAVRKCDPLRVPPQYAPYFDEWKVETIHFDPRDTQN